MMERTLRKKFICVSFGVASFVLLMMVIVINVANYLQVDDMAMEIIAVMEEHDGRFPQNFDKPYGRLSEETPYVTRYFTVKVDGENNLISTDTRSVQMVNTEQAISFAEEVLSGSQQSGFADNYKFQVLETDYGKLLIFIDCAQDLTMFYAFLWSSIAICAVALFCVFILTVVLSKKAVSPIVESYQKQQQFITNITHELKTPLAIIKTNTEVLEMEHSESQWSGSIHNQIERLTELINYLVSLSKMEEGLQDQMKVEFSLSDAINEVVDSFEVLADSSGRTIGRDVQENISLTGDEQSIRLLVSILMDNALKYGSSPSEVQVSLKTQKGKTHIKFINAAENLEAGKYDCLFQRFYRMEGSRNQKLGGFGVGLAMAQSIVKNHGGTIRAFSKDGTHMEFLIII